MSLLTQGTKKKATFDRVVCQSSTVERSARDIRVVRKDVGKRDSVSHNRIPQLMRYPQVKEDIESVAELGYN